MNVQLTTELSAADLALLEKIYMASFPEEERRPWAQVCNPEKEACPRLYAILSDGKIAGLVTLWRFDRFAYVEHLAIDSSLRGSGIGSETIKLIIEEINSQPLVVEIEPPCAEQPETISRHNFYKRLGFSTIDTGYIQPPYSPELPSVQLHLMATTVLPPLSTSATLHREVYGKKS